MKSLLLSFLVSFFTLLQAALNYPQLFEAQGTPLYKSANTIKKFKKIKSLNSETTNYIQQLQKTKELGNNAQNSTDKAKKMAYLKALRALQKKHDKILQHSIKELNLSIKQNKYQKFLKIVDAGMFYYREKAILKEKIISYYNKNKIFGKKSELLDQIIAYDNSTEIIYTTTDYTTSNTSLDEPEKITNPISNHKKKIILLTRPGCPWCLKAKQLLSSSGNDYMEYNVNKPKGRKLLKKYNGNGVPLIVIDSKVIKGFNRQTILSALK